MKLKQFVIAAVLSAGLLAPALSQAAGEQFFMLPDYRVGPYGANGQDIS